MRFITPPENQGQIVVISYALTPDGIIQRVYDRADHSEAYYATPWTPSLERWAESSGPQNSAPPTKRWKKITKGWGKLLPGSGLGARAAAPRVMNYMTGDRLPGRPSSELVRESAKIDTGAVPAYRDERDVWQYVAPSERDFYRRHHGIDVITVWVD